MLAPATGSGQRRRENIREGEPPGEPPCRMGLTQRGSAGASPSHVSGLKTASHLQGRGGREPPTRNSPKLSNTYSGIARAYDASNKSNSEDITDSNLTGTPSRTNS